MLRKFFTTTIVFASFNVLFAQDSTKTFAISGSIDAFYRYNFSNPKSGTNNFTSFTNAHNSFELGMATLRADGSALSGKVTGTADLGFGRRAEENKRWSKEAKPRGPSLGTILSISTANSAKMKSLCATPPALILGRAITGLQAFF